MKSCLFIPTDMFPPLFSSLITPQHIRAHTPIDVDDLAVSNQLYHRALHSIISQRHLGRFEWIVTKQKGYPENFADVGAHGESCSPSQNKPEGRWTHSPLLCLPLKEQKMSRRRSQERLVSCGRFIYYNREASLRWGLIWASLFRHSRSCVKSS